MTTGETGPTQPSPSDAEPPRAASDAAASRVSWDSVAAARLCALLGWASLSVPAFSTCMSCGGVAPGMGNAVVVGLLITWAFYGVPAYFLFRYRADLAEGDRKAATVVFVVAIVAAVTLVLLTALFAFASRAMGESVIELGVRLLTGALLITGFVVLAVHTHSVSAHGGGRNDARVLDVAELVQPAGIRARPVRSAWVAGALLLATGLAWGAPALGWMLGDLYFYTPAPAAAPPAPRAAPAAEGAAAATAALWDYDARTREGLPLVDRALVEQAVDGRRLIDDSRFDLTPHRWKLDAALRVAGHELYGPYVSLTPREADACSVNAEGVLFTATHALLRWVPEGGYTLESTHNGAYRYLPVTAAERDLWPDVESTLQRAADGLGGAHLTQSQAYAIVDLLLDEKGKPITRAAAGAGGRVCVEVAGRARWFDPDGKSVAAPAGEAPAAASAPAAPRDVLHLVPAQLFPLFPGPWRAVLLAAGVTLALGVAVLRAARRPPAPPEAGARRLGHALRYWAILSSLAWLWLATSLANASSDGWSLVLRNVATPARALELLASLAVLGLLGVIYPIALIPERLKSARPLDPRAAAYEAGRDWQSRSPG